MVPIKHDRTIRDATAMLAGMLWHLVHEREHRKYKEVILRRQKETLFNLVLLYSFC